MRICEETEGDWFLQKKKKIKKKKKTKKKKKKKKNFDYRKP